jgi:hypothetical protein
MRWVLAGEEGGRLEGWSDKGADRQRWRLEQGGSEAAGGGRRQFGRRQVGGSLRRRKKEGRKKRLVSHGPRWVCGSQSAPTR